MDVKLDWLADVYNRGNSSLLSAGDQATQSSRLRVEQDCTQASPASVVWDHSYNQVGQPEPKHRRCHCTF